MNNRYEHLHLKLNYIIHVSFIINTVQASVTEQTAKENTLKFIRYDLYLYVYALIGGVVRRLQRYIF